VELVDPPRCGCRDVPHDHGRRTSDLGPVTLERLLDAMPAAFCLLDRDWCFRLVNTTTERLLARPRAEVLGRNLWEVLPGLVGTDYEKHYRSAVETGRPVDFEAPALPGSDSWYEVRVWPVPGGLAVYSVNVSERHRAQEAVARASARLSLLATVNAEVSGALDGESALGRLARLVVPTLTDGCIVTVLDREGRARDVGSWHADPGRRPLMARYAQLRLDTLPPASPVAAALSAGTEATDSVQAVLELMPDGPARDLLVALGPESAVVLPLTHDGRTVGVLTLYQDADRVFTDEDAETAREVAAQAGRAIARVHRQSEQAKLAEALQRSLLTDPPHIPDATVVVRYVPAAEAARVGGDWYDAFLQRDGAPVIVIGDVVGHDTAAAAAMGQLRGLLRGIAHYSGAGPAEALRGLDEAMAEMHDHTMATAAMARLERTDDGRWGRLRWANAGHPPPLILAPDGTVTVLGGPIGDLMLGVDRTAHRAEEMTALAPGSTVLLYTDGLADRPLEDLCTALLDRILEGTPQDDVGLVAVRVSGTR
jgi:PAS domain S-box-containing protein